MYLSIYRVLYSAVKCSRTMTLHREVSQQYNLYFLKVDGCIRICYAPMRKEKSLGVCFAFLTSGESNNLYNSTFVFKGKTPGKSYSF